MSLTVKRFSLTLCGALVAGASLFIFGPQQVLIIESLESKTITGGPVFNRIRKLSEGNQDIWMMNQSHHGSDAGAGQWDRLAIIVDKEKKTAQFLQIEPGPLEWSPDLFKKQVPYRVSCFMCHSNGPRAIRPIPGTLTWREKMTVMTWNFRIKAYGRVQPDPEHAVTDTLKAMPFRHRASIDNEVLRVKACVGCHREGGFLARGSLTRQNAITIQFMVESGQMPPLGFSVSDSEKNEIQNFIRGI